MLDNGYTYPVDQCLHAYADRTRWALIIETLGYGVREGTLVDTMWTFGNCVGPPGDYNQDFLGRLDNADELELINEQDKVWHRASGLVVRGIRLAIPSEVPDGIELFELFRLIVPKRRQSFLATEEELRRRVPQDLPELLRLDEWRHPDLVEKERPSASESFRQLAHVIVARDPKRFVPHLEPNTHWSNWPDGGTLA